jgi:hypothetical protein
MTGERPMSATPRYGDLFTLFYFTDDPVRASWAARAGVNRIGPDLEIIGKRERQSGMNSRISAHKTSSIRAVRDAIGPDVELQVRTNPVQDGSADEIDKVIEAGADRLMLPYFKTLDEVRHYADLVDQRVPITLLIETAPAARLADSLAALEFISDFHIGLNDLNLSLQTGKQTISLIHSPIVEAVVQAVHKHGKSCGIGGVAIPGKTDLPISADTVLDRYVELNSNAAMLSRSFDGDLNSCKAFIEAVKLLRSALNRLDENK